MISKEKDLFEFLKVRYIPDLRDSDDKFSKYDCYSEELKLDIELKCRKTHYDNLLIEKSKYDYLVSRSARFNTRAFYVNSTPDGVYAFNLSSLPEPEWEDRMMPKTSHFSDRNKVIKKVGYINVSKARKIYEGI